MAKNIQRKQFMYVDAGIQKINPTATAPIKRLGLKVKTNFTQLKMPGILKEAPGICMLIEIAHHF